MSLRKLGAGLGLVGYGALSCASQNIEPQVASSATHAHYDTDYPLALQATANDFVNSETNVRRATAEFPKYPEQLKDPPWPLVERVVNRADEAGRSESYVTARRELDGTLAFFTVERDELTRKVAGSAQ